MAILDTLYLLFKSDTGDAEKGIATLSTHVKSLTSEVLKLATAWLSVSTVFEGFKNAVDYGININQASKMLNVNTEALDEWGGAIRRVGGTIEGFESSLGAFAQHLGTSADVAIKLLPQLADALHKLPRFQAMQYGKMLGLDEHTILLLQQGRRELDALLKRQKELGVVTKENAEVFGKFQQEMQDTGHAFRSLFIEIGMTVLPIIGRILEAFKKASVFIRRHSNLIIGALIPIGAVLGIVAAGFVAVNAPVILLTILVIGLISAFALLYDDIKVFMEGGDSEIGHFVEKFGFHKDKIIKGIKEIIDAFSFLNNPISHLDTLGQFATNAIMDYFGEPEDVKTAHRAIMLASVSPIATHSSSSFLNSRKSVNLHIGDITINTQATDSEGIAYGLKNELQKQISQAQNNFATGRAI